MKPIGMIIGAGENAIHTIKKAREHGIYVVGIDGNPNAKGLSYADKAIVADITDKEIVSRIVEEIKPDFMLPVPIGRYLTMTGYINEKYHLKGIGREATELSTDKHLFHKQLAERGLRPVRHFLINNKTNIGEINITFPAVIKPRFGSGSREVYYVTNQQELENTFLKTKKADEDFIVEQAVEGTEYGVDGAVIGGILYITLLRKKSITPLPFRQAIAYFSIVNSSENEELLNRVRKHLEKTVYVLKYKDCLLHADIIVNEEEVFAIEIAPRPSGHNLHDVFVPRAAGIDIAEEYIKFLLGKPYVFEANQIHRMQIRFFDFEDVVITKTPNPKELNDKTKCSMVLWNCNIKEGDKMQKIVNGHSVMGRGFFIVEGKDEQDLKTKSESVLSLFSIEKIKY